MRIKYLFLLIAASLFFCSFMPRAVDENTVVFLSDLHTDPNGYQPGRLKNCVAEILKMDPLPANVICLGDLAFLTGKPEEYAVVQECLKPLEDAGLKLTLAMGNHDRRAEFAKAFPTYAAQTLLPGRFVYKVVTPYVDFLILDTLQESEDPTKWITPGELLADQREWLEKQLEAYQKPVFVCAHHPIYELGLEKTLPKSSCCCGFIYGHDHFWADDFRKVNYGRQRIIRTLCLPSTGHWGDIGYTVIKIDFKKAVATLHELEFFFPAPSKDGVIPDQWKHIAQEHDGSVCTFDFEILP